MGLFNNGQPANLDQMYGTVPSSTSGPLNPFGLPDNPNFSFDPARLQQPLSFDGINVAHLNAPTTPDTTDVFGAGNNPMLSANVNMNNPIAPMPTPATGGMSSDFANQLLSGIGNLFDKYLPNPSMKQDNLGMGATNQITPPSPPEAPMTEDTSSSLPASLGSQGMFTPGRGY